MARAGKTSDPASMIAGTPRVVPIQIMKYSLILRWRSARAMSRARFAPKSRCSTTRLRLARATLWLSMSRDAAAQPAALASGLPDA